MELTPISHRHVLAYMKAKDAGYRDGYEGSTPTPPPNDPVLRDAYIKGYGEGNSDGAYVRVQTARIHIQQKARQGDE